MTAQVAAAGPLRLVLAELEAGTPTLAEVARNCGLDEAMTRAVVDHLMRSGRVRAAEFSLGCPASGCGGCASATDLGTPGCGRPNGPQPVAQRRPGLVALSLTPR